MHLPVEIKNIQVGYLNSSYFKDIYILDSLLFKIAPEKEIVVLAVPEVCADKIITLYHSSLFAGHQGVIKTY